MGRTCNPDLKRGADLQCCRKRERKNKVVERRREILQEIAKEGGG